MGGPHSRTGCQSPDLQAALCPHPLGPLAAQYARSARASSTPQATSLTTATSCSSSATSTKTPSRPASSETPPSTAGAATARTWGPPTLPGSPPDLLLGVFARDPATARVAYRTFLAFVLGQAKLTLMRRGVRSRVCVLGSEEFVRRVSLGSDPGNPDLEHLVTRGSQTLGKVTAGALVSRSTAKSLTRTRAAIA